MNESLGKLAKFVPDPEHGGNEACMERQLILLVRNTKTIAKQKILNAAMLAVAINLKKDGFEHVDMTTRLV